LRELEGRILRQEPELAAAPTVASASAAGPVLNSEGTSTDAPSATPASGEERKTGHRARRGVIGSVEEQQDPEHVHARRAPVRRRIRQEIERHGGTVEGFVGDTVTAVFGAPAAHEDDRERAVRAALTIREAVRECDDVHVRIGIATGAALVACERGRKPTRGR